MKFYKHLLFVAILVLGAGIASAQSKKTIREKKIVSVTVNEYFLEEGMVDPVVESIEKFNAKGELVEVKEFNKSGDVKKWEKYAYDADGNLVEEVFLDMKGRVSRTEKTIYDGDLKVQKNYFDNKDYLYKKKVYNYEYSQ